MKPLKPHTVPRDILDIELKNDMNKYDSIEQIVKQSRTDGEKYVKALKSMIKYYDITEEKIFNTRSSYSLSKIYDKILHEIFTVQIISVVPRARDLMKSKK